MGQRLVLSLETELECTIEVRAGDSAPKSGLAKLTERISGTLKPTTREGAVAPPEATRTYGIPTQAVFNEVPRAAKRAECHVKVEKGDIVKAKVSDVKEMYNNCLFINLNCLKVLVSVYTHE